LGTGFTSLAAVVLHEFGGAPTVQLCADRRRKVIIAVRRVHFASPTGNCTIGLVVGKVAGPSTVTISSIGGAIRIIVETRFAVVTGLSTVEFHPAAVSSVGTVSCPGPALASSGVRVDVLTAIIRRNSCS